MNKPTGSASTSMESSDEIFGPEITRQKLEREILPAYVGRARWFGGKARDPKGFTVVAAPALGNAKLLLVRIDYADGATDTYLVPLQMAANDAARITYDHPQ